MNKNISIMTASIAAAGILTIAVFAHAAFAQDTSESDSVCDSGNFVTKVIFLPDPTFQSDPPKSQSLTGDPPKQSMGGEESTHIAIGGGGDCMSGGAGGAGGEGGQGGTNFVKHTDRKADVDQHANGGKSNGGNGGNANDGNAY
jgi:hypothetical protein